MKINKKLITGICLICLLTGYAQTKEVATVLRIVDGDTLKVSYKGQKEILGLLV